MKRDYLRSSDYDAGTMNRLFGLAVEVKRHTKRRKFLKALEGYTAALIFQKPSLRTRVTFEIGMRQLGGSAIYLSPNEISLGQRESVYDVAKNLERWVDLVVARVYSQSDVEGLAEAGEPPVINALSDDEHPCQAMADFLTLYEKGLKWPDVHLAYVGDGNNVCTSLMIAGAALGIDMRVAGPARYAPPAPVIEHAKQLASKSGGKLLVTEDWREAVSGANAVYTDIWASMGKEEEAACRRPLFQPYQVNKQMMSHAERGAFVMHDLPAHRGEEITSEVMDSEASVVFDQAENRLHAQKAIMLECMGIAQDVARQLD